MFLVKILKDRTTRIRDFRRFERNVDYFVDFTESGKFATLTTAIKLRRGDKVRLLCREEAIVYSVEKIESYWNDDSIQTIWLEKI